MLSCNVLQALCKWLHGLTVVRCREEQSRDRAPSLEAQLPLARVCLFPRWPQYRGSGVFLIPRS